MLEAIFTVDELVDNLRIVYQYRSEKEKYELMKITNEDGDEAVVPFSQKTLYDLYRILGKKLRTAFDDVIDRDNDKKQKFREMKLHDNFINDIVDIFAETSKSRINKIREAFRDGFLINRTLMEEFRMHKLEEIVNDTIAEETGLLDNYYIGSYLELYHDVDIDFETLLINTINTYTKYVSDQTKAHYPRIVDFGTAYEYFYKVRVRTLSEDNANKGRLYYRTISNSKMIEYVKTKCTKIIRRSALTMIAFLFTALMLLLPFPNTSAYVVGFIFILSGINVVVNIYRATAIIDSFRRNISHEDNSLDRLAKIEHENIGKWYHIV